MKFIIETQKLKKTLELLNQVKTKSSPSPHLSSVKIQAAKGLNGIAVIRTNLNTWMRDIVECDVVEDGVCCVNIYSFLQAVKSISDDDVSVSGDNIVKVESTKSKFEFTSLDVKDFPEFAEGNHPKHEFEDDTVFYIDPVEFAEMINVSKIACNMKASQQFCHGVLLEIIDNRLRTVGMNSNAMSWFYANTTSNVALGGSNDALINTTTSVPELLSLLKYVSCEQVKCVVRGNVLLVHDKNTFMCTNLIDVPKPNVNNVMANIDKNNSFFNLENNDVVDSLDAFNAVAPELYIDGVFNTH